MKSLSANWITEHLVDFEYKKYLLLAYLQEVKQHFGDRKLYPDLTELITHYKNLMELKTNTDVLKGNFKKTMNGFDFRNLQLKFENMNDEEWFNELKLIIDFSLPLMATEVNEGKTIFDFVEKNILFHHVGLLPINKNEGYFLLNAFQSKQVNVYTYNLSALKYGQENTYGLSVSYCSNYTISLSKPVDKIKLDIIDNYPQLPNPAVYLFKAKTSFPNEETFLPVVKRMLFSTLVNSKT
jgi:hypothetical protein